MIFHTIEIFKNQFTTSTLVSRRRRKIIKTDIFFKLTNQYIFKSKIENSQRYSIKENVKSVFSKNIFKSYLIFTN